MQAKSFRDVDLHERLLYSAFLILMGVGYLMAMAYLYVSHQMHDGKPGVSIEDIAFSYYGNRSGTRLESAIRGTMSGFLQPEERHTIVAWLQEGGYRPGYEGLVRPIIEQRCLACHGRDIPRAPGQPDLSSYDSVHEVANIDTGMSLLSLLRVSHIHLFGIGMLLFAVGMIFRRAQLAAPLKVTLILLPYLAVAVDILAWFLTKWDPHYAVTVVTAGVVLGGALAAQILISLYQMWWPWRGKIVR
ncbi:MAG: hypothetical protein HY940_04330 [Gammaproteobacteria bacterium]|nr:hypothetical protein [Gammaproteobacteria bacterium]